jgi:hypothetical protein
VIKLVPSGVISSAAVGVASTRPLPPSPRIRL